MSHLPEGNVGNTNEQKIRRPRRPRTVFTTEQLARLEVEFAKDNYVPRPRSSELAVELCLPEYSIKMWFKNRRVKDRRQKMSMLAMWPYAVYSDPTFAASILQAAAASAGGLAVGANYPTYYAPQYSPYHLPRPGYPLDMEAPMMPRYAPYHLPRPGYPLDMEAPMMPQYAPYHLPRPGSQLDMEAPLDLSQASSNPR